MLRLWPPSWMFSRRLIEPLTLGGRTIQAGTMCLISPALLHRDARYFPDPLKFDPGRWTESFEASLPRFAYFPFGGGPRLCIGNNFALTEATLVIALTAQRYRLDLVPGQTVKAKPKGTLRPRPAVWMAPRLAS